MRAVVPSNTWRAYELDVFPGIVSCVVFLATPANKDKPLRYVFLSLMKAWLSRF